VTSVPILVFLGVSVLDLGPMYTAAKLVYHLKTNRKIKEKI